MKIATTKQGLFIASLLAASAVSAQEYPAADFQPKVVYQDPSIVAPAPAKAPVATASASAPCVSKEEKVEAKASEVDAQYPAANFQPKVIYSN